MKKNLKRFLSVLLVVALCFGIGPILKLDLSPKAADNISGSYQDYDYEIRDGKAWITDYHFECNSSTVTIPKKINGYEVYGIGNRAFERTSYDRKNYRDFQSVTIPNTVEEIGNNAFTNNFDGEDGTAGLETVYFENGSKLRRIGDSAFLQCVDLRNITLPDSLIEIGSSAFSNCLSLTNLVLPSNLQEIGAKFIGTTSISSITIPKSVKKAINAFSGYPNKDSGVYNYLNEIKFESGIEYLPDGIFKSTNFKTIDNDMLPDTIKVIGDGAFESCPNLETITIPKNTEIIGTYAFSNCANLKEILFEEDSSLNTILQSAFENCKNLETVSLPESLKTIQSQAFRDCKNLNSIVIPIGVSEIQSLAFFNSVNTIYGYKGTVAEQYANDNDITFVPLGEAPQQQGDCIAVFSTNPTMTLIPKAKLTLGFKRVHDGKIDETWNQMAIAVSDPSVLSISDYYSVSDGDYNVQGYAIDVTGLKPGMSHLVISDTKTGLSTTVTIKVDNPADVLTFPIRKPFGVKVINGTVFDNYWFEYDESSKNYTIHLDAYNFNYFIGSVDVFSSEGKWIGSEIIDKFSKPHNLYSLGEKFGNFVTDLGSGRPIIDFEGETLSNYKNKTMTQHTNLEFTVPEGGYFRISNSFASSLGTSVWGLVDLYFVALSLLTDHTYDSMMDQTGDAFNHSFKEKLYQSLNSHQISIFIANIANDRLLDLSQSFIHSGLSLKSKLLVISNLINTLKDMFRLIDFDFVKEIKRFGVGGLEEIAYLDPAGQLIEKVFKALEIIDLFAETKGLAESTDFPVYTFYTDRYGSNSNGLNSLFKDSGIIIEQNNSPIPEVVVQAFRVSNDTSLAPVLSNDEQINNLETYNISLIKNDQTVQPSGKVNVHIPVPTGLDKDTCSVYRKESNGSWTKLDAKVKGNYLVFETDHFSLYAITGTLEELSIKTLPTKLDYSINEQFDSDGLSLLLGDQIITDNYLCSPQVLENEGECEITVKYGHAETSFTVNVKENEAVEPEDPDESANDLDPSVNGIVQCPDGRWAMYKNGKVDTTCTTIAQNKYGWWRVKDGYVDFEAQGIYQNENGWWKTTNGKVTFLEFGLFENENGTWRVETSKVNFQANSIYQGKDGWYKTTNGKVTYDENGVFQNIFGWWYVEDSKVDFDFTGIASNKYGKWYINNGGVDFTRVGFVKVDGKSYLIAFGKVLFG